LGYLTTGWAKLNGANAVSFVVVKHVLQNLDIFSRWNNSSFYALWEA